MPSPETDLARFGRAVKKARTARAWSVRAGAEALGVSASALQQIEAGERDLGLSKAIAIARELGLSIDELGRL